MTELTLKGEPEIRVVLRRSAQARRMTLRLSALDGRVTLTVPPHVRLDEAVAFARKKERWLRSGLGVVPEPVAVGDGTLLPLEGRPVPVIIRSGQKTLIGTEVVSAPSVRALGAGLKTLARDRLAAAVDVHAATLGQKVASLTLRDTRSRWGSCSSAGRLMFSWRLIFAPPEVLQYVAAHEVAHLEHMDHSPVFWRVVERLYGDHRPARSWLRREGATLHRWRFDH